MTNGQRIFYTSENGDRWSLESGEDDIVSIVHHPNDPSGGERQTYELGAFLIRERHSPQNQALRALISSLTRIEPVTDAAPVEPPPEAIETGNGRQMDDNIDDLGRRPDGKSEDQPGVDIDELTDDASKLDRRVARQL